MGKIDSLARSDTASIKACPIPAKPQRPIIARLALNESPLPLPNEFVVKLVEELRNVNRYPLLRERDLESKLAEKLGIDSSYVLVGAGSSELMDMLTKIFLEPGDQAIIPIPTFPLYEFFIALAKGKPIFIKRTDDFSLNVEAICKAISERTKLIFIASPNNPTGNAARSEEISKLVEHKLLVVIDEAYVHFANESLFDFVLEYDNVVILRTFSKAFGLAGLRIGYMVANPRVVEIARKAKPPFSMNAIAIKAAELVLENPEYLKKRVELVKAGRNYLLTELRKFKSLKLYPSETNFLLVDISRTGFTSTKLVEMLVARGILIRDCAAFRGLGPNYVRITVGTMEENQALIRALDEILA